MGIYGRIYPILDIYLLSEMRGVEPKPKRISGLYSNLKAYAGMPLSEADHFIQRLRLIPAVVQGEREKTLAIFRTDSFKAYVVTPENTDMFQDL